MKNVKILVDGKHGLGDCVQVIPMLEIIKKNYPDCFLAVIVRSKASEDILKFAPVKIDQFYQLDARDIFKASFLKLVDEIRRNEFDYFIVSPITTNWKAKIFALMANAKHVIGEQYQNIDKYAIDNKIHMVERNVNLLKKFCDAHYENMAPKLDMNKYKGRKFICSKKKYIGICIGKATYSLVKGIKVYPRAWSIKKMDEIIQYLIDKRHSVILFGGTDELKDLKELKADLSSPYIKNFVGTTSIIESAYLASKCSLVIGVDTGMQHIADAVGVKTLSIFGPTNPKTHGAYSDKASFIEHKMKCQYCYGQKEYLKCRSRLCLNSVSSDEIIRKIEEELL